MMLRSKSKNTGPIQGDSRHKRKQNEQFDVSKNPSEPESKKHQTKGLTELRAHISGFLIDSAKRQKNFSKKAGTKENDENAKPRLAKLDEVIVYEESTDEEIQMADDPSDPCPHYNYDKEEANSPENVSEYAMDIFKYYKSRETYFQVGDYMSQHPELDLKTRAILVDWLVEIQESFELNHETLYNAVKLVDTYLWKTAEVSRDDLQMMACAAVFIAAKFDERAPPLADDLVYLAGDRFTRNSLMAMERELFSVVGFDLGSPLSYRYLRRLGRVCRVDMTRLTLARYILETSLLVYDYALVSGSRMAGAAFLLAMKMTDGSYKWNPILEKYSGYTGEEIVPLMEHLNHTMHHVTSKWKQLTNISDKYSHEIFFSAAKIPLIPDVYAGRNEIIPLPQMEFP